MSEPVAFPTLAQAVLNMTRSLASAGLEKETLLIVASDNGAVPYISNAESSSGSNWPLRGMKVREL